MNIKYYIQDELPNQWIEITKFFNVQPNSTNQLDQTVNNCCKNIMLDLLDFTKFTKSNNFVEYFMFRGRGIYYKIVISVDYSSDTIFIDYNGKHRQITTNISKIHSGILEESTLTKLNQGYKNTNGEFVSV